jgi:phospholipid transport system substrate-binding protein
MRNLCKYIIVAVAALSFSSSASAADTKAVENFVSKISTDVLEVIRTAPSDDVKRAELEKVFVDVVDINWMGKFVLGKNSRGLAADKMAKFNETYKRYLVESYVPKFKKYTGQKVEIIGTTALEGGEVNVKTKIIPAKAGDPEVIADYRIATVDGKFKVRDITAEGVSLITTQRSDFGSIISQNGFDEFINKLDEKAKKLAAAN